jgi:hypothetical protein
MTDEQDHRISAAFESYQSRLRHFVRRRVAEESGNGLEELRLPRLRRFSAQPHPLVHLAVGLIDRVIFV